MSSTFVRIINGVRVVNNREINVIDTVFPLIKGYTEGKISNFVTVNGSHVFGEMYNKIRINVKSESDVVGASAEEFLEQDTSSIKNVMVSHNASRVDIVEDVEETDEEIMERLDTRFRILQHMAKAVCDGTIRAVIVTGPAGIGKSYIVEREIEQNNWKNNRQISHYIAKGAMTEIGLYKTLYDYSDENSVLVFDDCDSVFQSDLALNLLKAALDTSKRRRICWNSESHALRNADIPTSFDFKGSIVFITNMKLENTKSAKLREHIAALESRCHYIDLTIDSTREKLLRIKQIADRNELFVDHHFSNYEENEIIDFLFENSDRLREVSLRTALKIADLRKSFPRDWKEFAKITIVK